MSISPIQLSSTTNTSLALQQQIASTAQPLHQSGDTKCSTFTLGGFEFADMEIPEKVTVFGGKQIVVVHEFVGGLRQLQALGAQPEKLSWTGMLFGSDPNTGAKARAFAIDAMRVQGTLQTLVWSSFNFSVIISAFHIEPQNDWMISYTIECEIQQDLSPGATTGTSVPGTDATFQSLINGAMSQATIVQNVATQNQSFFNSAIANVQQVNTLWGGQVAAMSQPNQFAASQLLQSSISGLTPVAQGSIQFDAAQAAAMISQMQNMNNIMQGFTGNPPNITSVINPNLFELAAVQYGDVTQWPNLATLNRLSMSPLQMGAYPNFVLAK